MGFPLTCFYLMSRLVGEIKLVEWIATAPHTKKNSRNQKARNAGTRFRKKQTQAQKNTNLLRSFVIRNLLVNDNCYTLHNNHFKDLRSNKLARNRCNKKLGREEKDS